MAAVNYPITLPGFCPSQFQFGGVPRTLAVESVLSGDVQTQGMPGKKWTASMTLPATTSPAVRAAVEAFLDSLNGQEVRVNLWHMGRIGRGGRGYPMGDINQSGLQVNANAAQFATTFGIKNCGVGKYIEVGDMVKAGNQLMMAPGRLVADNGGVIQFPVTSRLRAAIALDAPVTVVRPTAEFILSSPNWRATYNPGVSPELPIDWIEVFPG